MSSDDISVAKSTEKPPDPSSRMVVVHGQSAGEFLMMSSTDSATSSLISEYFQILFLCNTVSSEEVAVTVVLLFLHI
jgi:hypothetical protein